MVLLLFKFFTLKHQPMKKHILFTTLLFASINFAQGQTWNGSAVNTFTDYSHVGIMTGAYPTDAKLKIYGNTMVSGIGPSVPAVPELKIYRNTEVSTFGSPAPNHLEIWQEDFIPGMGGGGSFTPPVMKDVINPNGWLGILNGNPTQPLHVSGNARIEKDLFVEGQNIDMSQPSSDLPRTIFANSNASSLTLLSGHNGWDGAWITMAALGNTTHPGYMGLHTSGPGSFDFWNYQLGLPNWLAKIDNAGNFKLKNSAYIQGGLVDLSHGGGATSNIIGGSTSGWLGVCGGTGGGWDADGAYLQMFGNSSGGNGSMYVVSSGPSTSGTIFYYQPYHGTSVPNMIVRNDGKVVIGTSVGTPGSYRLYVQDGILTEKLKVANHTDAANWSDFVFDADYELMPLAKVESFVKKNKHLPEIPSASEVANDGIDVMEMDAKLLQKIEELTLYVIQQQKEIENLKKQIKN